jgi:hypothetical protein
MRHANIVADALTEPGTYRTSTGVLLHCHLGADGSVRIEIEDERAPGRRSLSEDLQIVKLSDDPSWPDCWNRPAVGWRSLD